MVEPRTSAARATICIDTNRGELLISVGSICAENTTRLTHTNQIIIPQSRARIGDCISVFLRTVVVFLSNSMSSSSLKLAFLFRPLPGPEVPKNGIGASIDVFGHTRRPLGRGLLPLSQRSVAEQRQPGWKAHSTRRPGKGAPPAHTKAHAGPANAAHAVRRRRASDTTLAMSPDPSCQLAPQRSYQRGQREHEQQEPLRVVDAEEGYNDGKQEHRAYTPGLYAAAAAWHIEVGVRLDQALVFGGVAPQPRERETGEEQVGDVDVPYQPAVSVLHDHGGRKRHQHNPHQEHEVDVEQRAVVSGDAAEDAVVSDPVRSYDPEADQERKEPGQRVEQAPGYLTGGQVLGQP